MVIQQGRHSSLTDLSHIHPIIVLLIKKNPWIPPIIKAVGIIHQKVKTKDKAALLLILFLMIFMWLIRVGKVED